MVGRTSDVAASVQVSPAQQKPARSQGTKHNSTNDSFGALTQSLMWVTTGDEVYSKNAIQALRVWADMDPDGYTYFPDAHIHTGHPLYQFLMAAEIIRATEPLADDCVIRPYLSDFAASITCCASMPNSFITSAPGALRPKRCRPITFPSRPTY